MHTSNLTRARMRLYSTADGFDFASGKTGDIWTVRAVNGPHRFEAKSLYCLAGAEDRMLDQLDRHAQDMRVRAA